MAQTKRVRRSQGHVKEIRPGVWRIWYEVPSGQPYRRDQRTMTIHGTRQDANSALRRVLEGIASGSFNRAAAGLTVSQYLSDWLDGHRERIRPSTLRSYEGIIRLYLAPRLGSLPLAKLASIAIERAWAELRREGLSERTILHTHRVLSRALKSAVRSGLIASNPASNERMDAPRPKRANVRALSKAERQRLVAHLEGSEWRAPLLLAYYTGLRRGELLGLRWEDVDLSSELVNVHAALQWVVGAGLALTDVKSDAARRSVALPPSAVSLLREQRASQASMRLQAGTAWSDNGFVFTDSLGAPVDPTRLTKAFLQICRAIGIDGVRLHDLRHTHATALLESGVHLKVVQARLGHSSISLTADTYSHVSGGLDAEAALVFERGMTGS